LALLQEFEGVSGSLAPRDSPLNRISAHNLMKPLGVLGDVSGKPSNPQAVLVVEAGLILESGVE
jgi:hypothetical protein